ncbi:MAG: ribonuclease P protein component [Proteobacteria bacterium]|nr:ribonuclease P protein component [Pseudomonadota bacterium]
MHILTIKESAEFQNISKKGQKFFSETLILLSLPTPQIYLRPDSKNFCRIGYTVAKTVSKLAVKRNLAKRRLREIIRNLAPIHAKNNFDYVVIARKEILIADFAKISNDLKFCITRIHRPKTSPNNAKKIQS